MATRTPKAKKVVNSETGTVTFNFSDGQSFTANMNEMPDAIRARLVLHGLSQKLGDTYAGDVESPYHEVRTLYDELKNGTWSQRAEGGGPRVTLLALAIANLEARQKSGDQKAKADDDAIAGVVRKLEALAEATDGEAKIAALRKNSRVAAEMEAIKAQRATAKAREAAKAAAGAEPVSFDLG